MRLRLRVERNGLPPTQALWPVKDPSSTVSQLLNNINETFPLEADTWGLEDYSVSVDGYEFLHYHELGMVCKDEDEVLIRPLQYVDVRARTITGRAQIAADGRHLVDGVPFGRPCLKAPVRPTVRIPPRKRRKLDYRSQDEATPPLLLTEYENEEAEEWEDEDENEDEEDEDEDFELEDSDDSDEGSEQESSDDEGENGPPSHGSDPTSTSDHDASDSESNDTSSSGGSWNGFISSAPSTSSRTDRTDVLGETPSTPSDVDATINHDNGNTSSVSEPHVATTGLPHQGKASTRSRNWRRRDVYRLRKLIAHGVLPQSANLETLRAWERQQHSLAGSIEVFRPSYDDQEHVLVSHDGENADSAITHAAKSTHQQRSFQAANEHRESSAQHQADKIAAQRTKLLQALASGGIDVNAQNIEEGEEDEPPQELSSKEAHDAVALIDSTAGSTKTTAFVPPAVARRSKLDIASSQRLLFGSLGVRVPKTPDERERLQERLARRPLQNVIITTDGARSNVTAHDMPNKSSPEEKEDAEAWKAKIDLQAVECCEMNVIKLSTPPFPFRQRWDPQQQRKQGNSRLPDAYTNNAGKKRKRARSQACELTETYDKYNTDGYGDALEYDDPDENFTDDVANTAADGEADDGFPQLPANLEDLDVLDEEHARIGDFIAFVELACDSATGWQPKMVTRLAKITRIAKGQGDDWSLQLSNHDVQRREYDSEGYRVYSKFEMATDEEEEDDDGGQRTVQWGELGIVRLVLRSNGSGEA